MATKKKVKSKKSGKQAAAPKPAAAATRAQGRAQAQEMMILNARLADLISTMRELQELQHAARSITAVRRTDDVLLRGEAGGADPGTATITFKKKSGPSFVRITLTDTQEEVLSPGRDEGTSQPRPVGTRLTAFIEVKGNPGEMAIVELGKAIPTTIQMSALPGETGNQGTKPVLVVG